MKLVAEYQQAAILVVPLGGTSSACVEVEGFAHVYADSPAAVTVTFEGMLLPLPMTS